MSSGFVSERDLEEARRKRQEEWEKVRSADQPEGLLFSIFLPPKPQFLTKLNDILEAPEEVIDHRSLFERLQEQKQKKDLEYEEAHKLSKIFESIII